jgi:hypothetical protein
MLEVRLLGKFEVKHDGKPLTSVLGLRNFPNLGE